MCTYRYHSFSLLLLLLHHLFFFSVPVSLSSASLIQGQVSGRHTQLANLILSSCSESLACRDGIRLATVDPLPRVALGLCVCVRGRAWTECLTARPRSSPASVKGRWQTCARSAFARQGRGSRDRFTTLRVLRGRDLASLAPLPSPIPPPSQALSCPPPPHALSHSPIHPPAQDCIRVRKG